MSKAKVKRFGCAAVGLAALLPITEVQSAGPSIRMARHAQRLTAPGQSVRFEKRSYVSNGATINVFYGPPTCSGASGISTSAGKLYWLARSGSGCVQSYFVSFALDGSAIAYPLSAMAQSARRGDFAGGTDAHSWAVVPGQPALAYLNRYGRVSAVFRSGVSGIPEHVVTAADGSAYFDETDPRSGEGAIAKITTSGEVTEYRLPYHFEPGELTIGPDKNLWVADRNNDRLAQVVEPQAGHGVWTLLNSKGFIGRSGGCASVVGSKIYVIGGETSSGTVLRTNQAYDTATNTWATYALMPTARTTLACGVGGKTIYAIGGGTTSSWIKTVESYDTTTNKWTRNLPAMPTARNSVSAVTVNGVIYVIGGYSGTRTTATEAFDTRSLKWIPLKNMLIGRSEVGLGVIGSSIVAAGGVGGETDNEVYSISKNTWTELPAAPNPRYNMCAGAIAETLYLAGGSNGAILASVDYYDTTSKKWDAEDPGAPMKMAVTLPAGAVYNGKLLCFGGGNSDFTGTTYSLVQSYTP